MPSRFCLSCGVEVIRVGHFGPFPKYCSSECVPNCEVLGCDQPSRGSSYCARHKAHFRRNGIGAEVKSVWSTERSCLSCGQDGWPPNGRRKFCSSRCQSIHQQNGNCAPEKFVKCAQCDTRINLWARHANGRKKRSDTLLCTPCKRAMAKPHRTSVVKLCNRDGDVCGICDQPIDTDLNHPDPLSASVDHILPRAHGGSHDLANLQLAHLRCNLIKQQRKDFKLVSLSP